MNETFQSLFENVCRCFGHTTATNGQQPGGSIGESALPRITPNDTRNNNGNNNNNNNNTDDQHQQPVITQVNSHASSVSGKIRTNKLELNDQQYDELFVTAKQQHQQRSTKASSSSLLSKIPPRQPQGNNNNNNDNNHNSRGGDNETAQAVAQAKIAANPNRYRPKRKRSAQTREEIFRNKNKQQQQQQHTAANNNGGGQSSSVRTGHGCGVGNNNNNTPQSDFSRLLNPSLALCFASPIRGTEDNMDNNEHEDVRSVDASDTATLNTNGEDTITSTLYFDSKYAHIQETRPPMPLFNQFKLGHTAQDEIRTIMATDSHSSVRMVEIMHQNDQQQQQQQHQQHQMPVVKQRAVGKNESSMNVEEQKQQGRVEGRSNKDWGRSSPNRVSVNNHNNNSNQRTASTTTTSLSQSSSHSLRKKDTITTHNHGSIDPPDEEMEDAVPDVKAVSSSTDSSRLSNTATRHTSL